VARAGAAAVMALATLVIGGLAARVDAQSAPGGGPAPDQSGAAKAKAGAPSKPAPIKPGVSINKPGAFQGYTLLAPLTSRLTYLVDMEGRVVQKWEANCTPASGVVLLENGHLLRAGTLGGEERAFGGGPGAGGRVQEFTGDGELVWDFKFYNDKQLPHHDVIKLPSGNVLMIVWDKKTAKEAVAAGRQPEAQGDRHLLPDSLIEVKPTGKTTGTIVWEWHLWDHLIQDHDSSKANYGDVAAHPELVDINHGEGLISRMMATKDGQEKLRSLGYLGGSPTATPKKNQRVNSDWTHANGVAYNAEFDQVILSIHAFSEFWIIDHSTTTAEAAGHSGGRSGKGGDLLYRWGNPLAYRAGTSADQKLFSQHNAHWIAKGLPGAGHVLVFNNGGRRPGGDHSSVDELVLPVDEAGRYARKEGAAFGPDRPVWSYTAPNKSDFYSFFISGAQRLPNGNTLICSGAHGTFFEVTPEKEIVWRYKNPVKGGMGFGPGGGFPGPPPLGMILPPFLLDDLHLSAAQKKQMEEFQKEVSSQLEKALTDQQKERLRPRGGPGPGGFGGLPLPGQIMAASTRAMLRLSAEQKGKVDEIQKAVDAKLATLFNADQKKRLEEIRRDFGRGGPPGGPGGPGGPPGGPGGPGGPPGGPGGAPPGENPVFRAYRYGPDFPGLAGKDLKPGKTVEELQPKEPEKKQAAR
jgi:hypothetical protein